VVHCKTINAKSYDLKAVNPNAPDNTDQRTPEELLAIIDAKGREVEEALAMLRKR
jgi:type I restriction enzyme M protein